MKKRDFTQNDMDDLGVSGSEKGNAFFLLYSYEDAIPSTDYDAWNRIFLNE